jgi:hypothetical protein
MRDLNVNLAKEKILSFGTNIDFYCPKILEEIYGRKNLGLKIFARATKRHRIDFLNNQPWTKDRVEKLAIFQNILAFENLAPRVYDIVRIEKKYGHVVEFIKGEGTPGFTESGLYVDACKKIDSYFKKYSIVEMGFDGRNDNFIDGKAVDLNDFYFKDFNRYKKDVIKRVQTTQAIGNHGIPQSYQTFDEISGDRDTKFRVERMELDKDNFSGKTVLDLGCSMGAFCHEAAKRGAKRIFGIDLPKTIKVAKELASLKGYHNIDFLAIDVTKNDAYEQIKKATGFEKFDIIFWLSMSRYMGKPAIDWMLDCCDEILYGDDYLTQLKLPPKFKTVELEPIDNRRIFKGYIIK